MPTSKDTYKEENKYSKTIHLKKPNKKYSNG